MIRAAAPVKPGMARRLTYQIGGCVVADPFKAVLFVKRGLVIAVSFSVGLDRSSSGKSAGADNACDGGHGEETAPRRVAWREHHWVVECRRVCGWRAKHAVSLGHWISTPCGRG
jgi:hypothetical protein